MEKTSNYIEKSSASNTASARKYPISRNMNIERIHTNGSQKFSGYIQAKLTVGAADNSYENEADAVADKVMRMPEKNFAQRKCAECEKEEKERIHRKPLGNNITPLIQTKSENSNSVSDGLSQSIESSRGSGSSLDGNTQSFMSSRFGSDFSNVRIHTDNEAGQMNRDLNAKAFTVGNNIYFNGGQYQPNSSKGKQLLAHELTHVVQQNSSSIQSSSSSSNTSAITKSSQQKIQRFAHDMKTCKDDDLKDIIWPGDYIARQMVKNALIILDASPPPSYLAKLLKNYFMTENPEKNTIRNNFNKIQNKFFDNDYTYVCRNDCESSKTKSTMGMTKVGWFGGSGPIILCVNNIRNQMLPSRIAAATIIHEFAHRYLDFSGDTYCSGGDCSDISPEEALKNPDSYSEFANDVDHKKFIEELKAKNKAVKQ